MQTIPINKKNAVDAYKNADAKGKKLLSDLLGTEVLDLPIMERVLSVADALALIGKTVEDFKTPGDTKDETAYKILKAVIKVLNEEWVPDYSNSSQTKYEPYFKISGSGLSYDHFAAWGTYTYCGVRLCYRSYDLMRHGVKILDKYYNDYLNF